MEICPPSVRPQFLGCPGWNLICLLCCTCGANLLFVVSLTGGLVHNCLSTPSFSFLRGLLSAINCERSVQPGFRSFIVSVSCMYVAIISERGKLSVLLLLCHLPSTPPKPIFYNLYQLLFCHVSFLSYIVIYTYLHIYIKYALFCWTFENSTLPINTSECIRIRSFFSYKNRNTSFMLEKIYDSKMWSNIYSIFKFIWLFQKCFSYLLYFLDPRSS